MPNLTTNYGLQKPLDNETADIAVVNQNMDIIDTQMKINANTIITKANQTDLAAHLADYMPHISYAAATGAANAYTVSLTPAPTAYTEGMAIAVKINVDNTGASTINVNNLGAKAIKKPNGIDVSAGNLKAGSIYTLRYNGTNFILQGSDAAGNATPADVLSGKTFTNDQGEQTGTMPNRGQVIITPGTTNQSIVQGYHDGTGYVVGDADLVSANIKSGANIFGVAGKTEVVDTTEGTAPAAAANILSGKVAFVNGAKVTGNMPNQGAYNINPGVSNITIPAGYHNGSGVVYGDADLIADNIISGKNIFGVAGLAPRFRYASGIINSVYNQTTVISGLAFTPKVVCIKHHSNVFNKDWITSNWNNFFGFTFPYIGLWLGNGTNSMDGTGSSIVIQSNGFSFHIYSLNSDWNGPSNWIAFTDE